MVGFTVKILDAMNMEYIQMKAASMADLLIRMLLVKKADVCFLFIVVLETESSLLLSLSSL